MLQALEIIKNILIVLFWICEVYVVYYVFLYIVGFIFHKQKYPMVEDKQKFCIFVPCHNEGPVIAATVENYTHINYSEDLFDIYFIADNCSDDTANIIKEAIKKSQKSNFHVLVRKEKDINKRGKPHALRWAIDCLESEGKFYAYYDMMIIFDADNFVDADIFSCDTCYYHIALLVALSLDGDIGLDVAALADVFDGDRSVNDERVELSQRTIERQ